MKALFLILFVFSILMLFLGFSARNNTSAVLGNALIFGAVAIDAAIIIIWLLFKFKGDEESGN